MTPVVDGRDGGRDGDDAEAHGNRFLGAQAKQIEQLESTNAANMETCTGIIKGLTAQIEALQADAERYRWLRDRAPWTLVSSNGMLRLAVRLDVDYKPTVDEAGNDMDAAIDAARKGNV